MCMAIMALCEGLFSVVFGIITIYGLAVPLLNSHFQSLLCSLVYVERFSKTLWVRDVHRPQVSIEAGVQSLKRPLERDVCLNIRLE